MDYNFTNQTVSMNTISEKSHAKINLNLNVVGKTKNLHKLQSIVSLISLYDEISLRQIDSRKHKILFKGKFSKKITSRNTIYKTLSILDKKKLLKKKFFVIVKKNIPVKSGMGGGSMNAATLINIFMKNKIIKINKKKLQNINDSIGQDVKLGFFKNIMYLDGNNSVKILNKKTKYFLLLFMPKHGCSTKYIFSKVKKYSKPLKNIKNKFNNLGSLKNDLQDIVIKKYPELKKPIEFLENQPGINFVKMTGSGSCFVAYSKSRNSIINSFKKFRKNYPKYWSVLSKTI